VDYCVVFGEEGPVASRLKNSGISVVILPHLRSKISPFQDWTAYKELSKIVENVKPDLIHLHSSKSGMVGRFIGVRYKLPTIYTVHGWGWRGLRKFNAMLVWFIEWALHFIPNSYYIFVSQDVADDGEAKIGIPSIRSETIYNGVNDMGINPGNRDGSDAELKIIMPARVSTAKDHMSLVKAFELLDAPAILILCGGGTNEECFQKKLRLWAPTKYNQIISLGQRSDISDLLSDANIFTLISNFEALPLSIIEAMSTGLPIVASNVGGVGELIKHNETGLLVEKGNIEQIREMLEKLAHVNDRKRLGGNARVSYLQSLTSERMAESTLRFYRYVLGAC